MSEWQFNNYYPPYISHHGILGQKWGVRRYQYADGTLTPAGRKRYRVDEKGDLVEKTKAERKADAAAARKESIEKKRQTRLEREHETEEKMKERIANSRDPALIYKNKDMFNYQELTNLYNIMQKERDIKNLIPRQVTKGEAFVQKLNSKKTTLEAITNYANAGTKAWDVVAKVSNAFLDTDLPIINQGKNKKGDGNKNKNKENDNDESKSNIKQQKQEQKQEKKQQKEQAKKEDSKYAKAAREAKYYEDLYNAKKFKEKYDSIGKEKSNKDNKKKKSSKK